MVIPEGFGNLKANIQVPDRVRGLGSTFNSFRICRPKLINPSSNSFIGNIDAAFGLKLLDVSKAQVETEVELNSSFDYI